ncbi:unnamed protein product [Larinioides sclopetarius]|uniref:Uncharacterized protein n=1 Tax=Larinioides sclopetarius TaxID=280406 RepID=A0AAV1YVK2_9ARAC
MEDQSMAEAMLSLSGVPTVPVVYLKTKLLKNS